MKTKNRNREREERRETKNQEAIGEGSAEERAEERSAARIVLPYEPFAWEQKFHSSGAKYRLFGGAAGPGKSKALLMEAILQANEHAGVNTLLMRRTFPELEGSLLLYFRRDVPRELYRSYNDSNHTVTWWNGSTTRFGYSQGENDIYQYQGAEDCHHYLWKNCRRGKIPGT